MEIGYGVAAAVMVAVVLATAWGVQRFEDYIIDVFGQGKEEADADLKKEIVMDETIVRNDFYVCLPSESDMPTDPPARRTRAKHRWSSMTWKWGVPGHEFAGGS